MTFCSEEDHHWRRELTTITCKDSCKIKSYTYNVLLPTHREQKKGRKRGKETFLTDCDQSIVSDWQVLFLWVSLGFGIATKVPKWVSYSWFGDSSITDVSYFLNPSESVKGWRWQRWIWVSHGWLTFSYRLSHTHAIIFISSFSVSHQNENLIDDYFLKLSRWRQGNFSRKCWHPRAELSCLDKSIYILFTFWNVYHMD